MRIKKILGIKDKSILYENIEPEIKKKLFKDGLMFFSTCFFSLIIGILYDNAFVKLSGIFFIASLIFVWNLYYQATRDLLKIVDGVVIRKETSFTNKYLRNVENLYIQDADKNVYKVTISTKQKKYTVSNIVKIIFPKDKLNNHEEGVFIIGYPVLITATDVSVDSEN